LGQRRNKGPPLFFPRLLENNNNTGRLVDFCTAKVCSGLDLSKKIQTSERALVVIFLAAEKKKKKQ
jgi:hypothetical protein